MGLDFENFKERELGNIKRRQEEGWSHFKKIISIITIITIFTFLGHKISFLSNFFKSYFNYIFLSWLILLFILIYILGKNPINLNFKETILLNFCKAMEHFKKMKESKDKEDREKALSYFSNIAHKIERASYGINPLLPYENGFKFEQGINQFFEEFLIFLNEYLPPKIQINMSNEEYYELYGILLNIFVPFQDEKFDRINETLIKYTKQYHKPKKDFMSTIGQIKSSKISLILIYAFLVIILDLLGWLVFILLKHPYSHKWGIVVSIAFIAGAKSSVDFIKSVISKYSLK